MKAGASAPLSDHFRSTTQVLADLPGTGSTPTSGWVTFRLSPGFSQRAHSFATSSAGPTSRCGGRSAQVG